MGDPAGAARHVLTSLAPDGTWLIVEPFASDDTAGHLRRSAGCFSPRGTVAPRPVRIIEFWPNGPWLLPLMVTGETHVIVCRGHDEQRNGSRFTGYGLNPNDIGLLTMILMVVLYLLPPRSGSCSPSITRTPRRAY